MHRWSVLAGAAITGCVLAVLILWAHAALVGLRWIHGPGSAMAATRINRCAVGVPCVEYAAPCEPGETCETTVDLPTGDLDVWIHAGTPTQWSGPSNVEPFAILAPEGCAWDADGNGTITAADFGAFLVRFQRGEVNAMDFAAFLRAFGRPCA